MLVVSDASPLNILVRAELVDILPQLFTRVVIPPAVADELNQEQTPVVVREWLSSAPDWLEVRGPTTARDTMRKGRGEREAITLALEIDAELILADDRMARRQAESLGLRITGTIGVLERAADRNLVPLGTAIERVVGAGLFVSPSVVQNALRRAQERKSR